MALIKSIAFERVKIKDSLKSSTKMMSVFQQTLDQEIVYGKH